MDSFGILHVSPAEEMETISREGRPEISWTIHDISKTFPEAKSVIKKLIKEDAQKQKELDTLAQEIRMLVSNRIRDPAEYEFVHNMLMEVYVKIPSKKIADHTYHLRKIVRVMEINESPPEDRSELSIVIAKAIPISDFIEFNRQGMAKCIWHNEHSPSLKYYPKRNNCHCFGCNRGGDTIDVVQQIYNLDIRSALKLILKQ